MSTDQDRQLYEQAKLLVQRLERISVDSIWSRRSSGHRGALLHWIEQYEAQVEPNELLPADQTRLKSLVATGFKILERAALERLR
jgi:hypothetical protein